MSKIDTSADLWPAIRYQVESIIKELIRKHTAYVVWFARTYRLPIPWEYRLHLWLSFSAKHPAIEVSHFEFMDMFRDVHGLWPKGRRLTRRAL